MSLSQSKRSPRRTASRTILRSKSAIDGHLAGVSTDGLPLGTIRKFAILGASIAPLRFLPRPRTSFLKGTTAATTRVTSATVVKIMLKSNERTRSK